MPSKGQILISRHGKSGELKIIYREPGKDDKEYLYENVSPHQVEKLQKLIAHGSVGKCFQFLKNFAIKDFKKE